MIIKGGEYTVVHTFNMGNYESVKVGHTLVFDIEGNEGSVETAFADARSHIDKAIEADLGRAAQCTSFAPDVDETYIHEWIKEVY